MSTDDERAEDLERIEDACVARARLGVTDARRCETRSLAFVEPANGSMEAEEKRTMGEDEVDATCAGCWRRRGDGETGGDGLRAGVRKIEG